MLKTRQNIPGKQTSADRPHIRPEKEPFDLIIEIVSLIGVIVLVVLSVISYPRLPASIPTHFDAAGNANDYSSKSMIFLLPGIALVLYAGLSILNRFPYIFNYPVNITRENAFRMYRHATRMIRILNFLIVIMFLYLNWQTIAVAKGSSSGLGAWFLPLNIGTVLGVSIYMVIRMYKLK